MSDAVQIALIVVGGCVGLMVIPAVLATWMIVRVCRDSDKI